MVYETILPFEKACGGAEISLYKKRRKWQRN